MPEFAKSTPDDVRNCFACESEVMETSAGPVEYSVRGQGPALLVLHGGPGGFDQGLGLAEPFRASGFSVVAASRPGYLGTPLETGVLCEEQADAMAAFLESLGLGPLPVIATSAGAPAGYLLAARHPEKVTALVAIDGVSRCYDPDISFLDEAFFLSRVGLWLTAFMADHFPETTLKSMLATESTLDRKAIIRRVQAVMSDPLKYAYFQMMIHTLDNDFQRRKPGLANDLKQLAAIDLLPLDTISCPTLIMHGAADRDVPPSHAVYAHRVVKKSELHFIDEGSHLGFWISDEAEDAQRKAVEWLAGKV